MTKKTHHYRTRSGELVPGITTILQCLAKPALLPWAAKMAINFVRQHQDMLATDGELIYKLAQRAHEEERDSAALDGTRAHEIIADMLVFKPRDLCEKYPALAQLIDNWHVLATEIVVVNSHLGYGGTADALVEIDSEVVLVDFKTSSRIYPEHHLQLAAYSMAEPQDTDLLDLWEQIARAMVVHVDKYKLTPREQLSDLQVHQPLIPHLVALGKWWLGCQGRR